MSNILQTLERIQTSARKGASPKTRVIKTDAQFPVGKYIRQGDVMIRRLPIEDASNYDNLQVTNDRQIAPGTTEGSRHIAEGNIRVMARTGNPLEGPVIIAPEGFYISHPKHGHFDVGVAGCYEVTFPRDLAQEELARRRD